MFTWHSKAKQIFCRLDYWLVSEHLINKTHNTDIIPCTSTDHSCITLSIKSFANQKRGPSYWKFNITTPRQRIC